jgi:hypothetical protein
MAAKKVADGVIQMDFENQLSTIFDFEIPIRLGGKAAWIGCK